MRWPLLLVLCVACSGTEGGGAPSNSKQDAGHPSGGDANSDASEGDVGGDIGPDVEGDGAGTAGAAGAAPDGAADAAAEADADAGELPAPTCEEELCAKYFFGGFAANCGTLVACWQGKVAATCGGNLECEQAMLASGGVYPPECACLSLNGVPKACKNMAIFTLTCSTGSTLKNLVCQDCTYP
ncbi:MAG: hypothetical protein R3B13_33730 [Polyangiaceae bacterium]